MSFDPNEINLARELSYHHPFTNNTIFFYLLASLLQQQRSPRTNDSFEDEYDYVIVGGGTAGSLLASRLSEEQCATVLLLENGGHPPIISDFTAVYTVGWDTDIDYKYVTASQKNTAKSLTDRRIKYPRGKVLGGSSILNAMQYVRGNRRNFDDWEKKMGAKGWGYEQILKYFKKSENNQNAAYVASGFHGGKGELPVQNQVYIEENQAPVLEAAKRMGYRIGDCNGAIQSGFTQQQGTTRNSQRCSAAKAFLVPAENRTNLDILVNAHVNKVEFEKKKKELWATKVVFDHGGQTYKVKARREVILSAGSINTPQILMLSGIGPKKELRKHGIEVVKNLPVGESFQDHPASGVYFVMNDDIRSTVEKVTDENNIRQFIHNRTGPLASLALHGPLGFLQNDENKPGDFPDYELLFFKSDVTSVKNMYGVRSDIYNSFYKQYEGKPLLQCHVCLLQPKSVGAVTLNSSNPYDNPIFDPNFLDHPDDAKTLITGLKKCMRISQHDAVKNTVGSVPFAPFPACKNIKKEDDYFACYVEHFIAAIYHPTSTAKMGDPKKKDTVVSPELKVKGIKNLRVVDASVMPTVPSGHTMATVYMVAEKAADMIKEDLYKDQPTCKKPSHT